MLADKLIAKLCSENRINKNPCSNAESAILYAERFQQKPKGFYNTHQIPPKTEQAIMLMVERIANSTVDENMWNKVESLLHFNIN